MPCSYMAFTSIDYHKVSLVEVVREANFQELFSYCLFSLKTIFMSISSIKFSSGRLISHNLVSFLVYFKYLW